MATFKLADQQRQINCIIFDKDGTLIDLDRLWSAMASRWIEIIADGLSLSAETVTALDHTIGYDRANHAVVPDGPLAVTTLPKLAVVMATVLHQSGVDWHKAVRKVEAVLFDEAHAVPTREMLVPLYSAETLDYLHASGITLAILTSDDRKPTEASLKLLGIESLFSAVGCADDPVPPKPNPDGIYRIAKQVNIAPANMLMIGDSLGDMATGRNAGVAASIGIGTPQRFGTHADVAIASVDQLLDMLVAD